MKKLQLRTHFHIVEQIREVLPKTTTKAGRLRGRGYVGLVDTIVFLVNVLRDLQFHRTMWIIGILTDCFFIFGNRSMKYTYLQEKLNGFGQWDELNFLRQLTKCLHFLQVKIRLVTLCTFVMTRVFLNTLLFFISKEVKLENVSSCFYKIILMYKLLF